MVWFLKFVMDLKLFCGLECSEETFMEEEPLEERPFTTNSSSCKFWSLCTSRSFLRRVFGSFLINIKNFFSEFIFNLLFWYFKDLYFFNHVRHWCENVCGVITVTTYRIYPIHICICFIYMISIEQLSNLNLWRSKSPSRCSNL